MAKMRWSNIIGKFNDVLSKVIKNKDKDNLGEILEELNNIGLNFHGDEIDHELNFPDLARWMISYIPPMPVESNIKLKIVDKLIELGQNTNKQNPFFSELVLGAMSEHFDILSTLAIAWCKFEPKSMMAVNFKCGLEERAAQAVNIELQSFIPEHITKTIIGYCGEEVLTALIGLPSEGIIRPISFEEGSA